MKRIRSVGLGIAWRRGHRRLIVAGLALGLILDAGTAGAQNVIGATAFVCDASGICGEIDGSVPGDALDSDTLELALVAGMGGSPGILVSVTGSRRAEGKVDPLPTVALTPPTLRVTAAFPNLISGVATAVAYWEDDLKITALDGANNPIIGDLIEFRPSVRILGTLTAEGDDDFNLAGFSGWGFNYTINEFTGVIGAGGSCKVPQASIVAECPGADLLGDDFGTFGPFQTIQIASGVSFSSQGIVWASVASQNFDPMKGEANLESAVKWQGFELFDGTGQPITNFTISSTSGIDWRLTSVPEPSSLLLQAASLLTLMGLCQVPHKRSAKRGAARFRRPLL